jgi:hypothetical protein
VEDTVALAHARGDRARRRGLDAFAERVAVQEEAAQQHAAAIRVLLRLDARVTARAGSHPSQPPGARAPGGPSRG